MEQHSVLIGNQGNARIRRASPASWVSIVVQSSCNQGECVVVASTLAKHVTQKAGLDGTQLKVRRMGSKCGICPIIRAVKHAQKTPQSC